MDYITFTSMPPKINYCEDGEYLVLVTPEVATWFFARNDPRQRKIRQGKVNEYAADIKNGRFRPVKTQAIVFSDKGLMIDGQHRVQAVIQSKTPAVMWVFTGQPDEDFNYIDCGLVRGNDEYLPDGLPNKKHVVTITNQIFMITHGYGLRTAISGGGKEKPTRQQMLEFFGENEDELTSIAKTVRSINNILRGGSIVSIGLFAYCSCLVFGSEKTFQMLDAIREQSDKHVLMFTTYWMRQQSDRYSKPNRTKQLGTLWHFACAYMNDKFPKNGMYNKHEQYMKKLEDQLNESRELLFDISPKARWKE